MQINPIMSTALRPAQVNLACGFMHLNEDMEAEMFFYSHGAVGEIESACEWEELSVTLCLLLSLRMACCF